jgi:hypothetical protein
LSLFVHAQSYGPWLALSRLCSYNTGNQYQGEVRNGKRHGRGVYTHKNGDCYIGLFAGDQMHGDGIWIRKDGRTWDGDWDMGKAPKASAQDSRLHLPSTIKANIEKGLRTRDREALENAIAEADEVGSIHVCLG